VLRVQPSDSPRADHAEADPLVLLNDLHVTRLLR
jgi:hypothetical protein